MRYGTAQKQLLPPGRNAERKELQFCGENHTDFNICPKRKKHAATLPPAGGAAQMPDVSAKSSVRRHLPHGRKKCKTQCRRRLYTENTNRARQQLCIQAPAAVQAKRRLARQATFACLAPPGVNFTASIICFKVLRLFHDFTENLRGVKSECKMESDGLPDLRWPLTNPNTRQPMQRYPAAGSKHIHLGCLYYCCMHKKTKCGKSYLRKPQQIPQSAPEQTSG